MVKRCWSAIVVLVLDLGAKDGGVYDWIGRANEKEFVSFFTSAYYTGTFNLARAKAGEGK
jgi:hypothetical protein